MTRINKITCAKCPSNRFITFFFCVLDPTTGSLAYANAGHNPPYLVRANGEITMLPGGGPPLGIVASATFAEESLPDGTRATCWPVQRWRYRGADSHRRGVRRRPL